jgi:hypothetical protein
MRVSIKGWTRGRLLGLTAAYAFVVFLLVSAAMNASSRRTAGSSGGSGSSGSNPNHDAGSKFLSAFGYGVTEMVTLEPLAEVKRNATPPSLHMPRPAIVVLCYNR